MVRKLTAATGKSIFSDLKRGKSTKLSESANKSNLSAALVQDSDSDSESVSDVSEKKETRRTPKTPKNAIQPLSTSQLSTESESEPEQAEEAEEEDDEEQDSGVNEQEQDLEETSRVGKYNGRGTSSKVNGLKRKSSADTHGSDDSSSDNTVGERSKKPRLSPRPTATEAHEAVIPDSQPVIPQSQASLAPPRTYVPPQGYRAITTSKQGELRPADIRRKELWHLTAPAGVPLTSLTTFDTKALEQAAVVLTHDGVNYIWKELSAPEDNTTVLLARDEGFVRLDQPIHRTFSLCAKLDLPIISTGRTVSRHAGSQAAADIATAAVAAIRPQPKGLRMRYKPSGSGSTGLDLIGSSSEGEEGEEEQPAQSFQFPKTVGGYTEAVNEDSPTASSRLQRKREKKLRDQQLNGTTRPAEAKPEVESQTRSSLDEHGNHSQTHNEERERRRAEKRRKKLAREKARELMSQ